MAKSRIEWHDHWSETCAWGFCPDEDAWEVERAKILKSQHIDLGPYDDENGLTTFYKTPTARALVTIGSYFDGKPDQLVSIISHESYHVAMFGFREMAEAEPGEEVVAYTLDRIVRQMFLDYIKHRRDVLMELCGVDDE